MEGGGRGQGLRARVSGSVWSVLVQAAPREPRCERRPAAARRGRPLPGPPPGGALAAGTLRAARAPALQLGLLRGREKRQTVKAGRGSLNPTPDAHPTAGAGAGRRWRARSSGGLAAAASPFGGRPRAARGNQPAARSPGALRPIRRPAPPAGGGPPLEGRGGTGAARARTAVHKTCLRPAVWLGSGGGVSACVVGTSPRQRPAPSTPEGVPGRGRAAREREGRVRRRAASARGRRRAAGERREPARTAITRRGRAQGCVRCLGRDGPPPQGRPAHRGGERAR
jgi:hypothetical protein